MTLDRILCNGTLASRSLSHTWVAIILWLAALPAAAQNQTWIKQLGTNGRDWANAAAPDGAGGFYAGGYTTGSLGGTSAGGYDAWLAHYDSAGNQTWIRQLGTSSGENAWAVAPDGSGGVYVSGSTDGSLGGTSAGGNDTWLARYDSAGNQTWIRQFGTSGSDNAYAAAPDSSGGVYLSGETSDSLGGTSAGSYDAWLAHYDSAGNQTWIRQLGTSQWDAPRAAAADGAGGVFVGGYTLGSLGGPNVGGYDAWLANYDSAGNQTWIRQFGTSGSDLAAAAAPDGSGGVYVSGGTGGSLGGPSAGGTDIWLARYDSAGNQSWIRQFGTSSHDYEYEAAPDGSGGVYVGGATEGSLGGPSAGGLDAWVAHYDSVGSQTCIQQLGTTLDDRVGATAPDGAGGLYAGGHTTGSLGGPNAGDYDAWFAHYHGGCPPSTYCTAKINSCGTTPAISSTGFPSASSNSGFTISSSSAKTSKSGLLIYTDQGRRAPAGLFQGGWLCLDNPIRRGPALQAIGGMPGQCDATFQLDMNCFAAGLCMGNPQAYLSVPGTVVDCQWWGRDTVTHGSYLSDAFEYTVCP